MPGGATPEPSRAGRLRAPLLLAVWLLLAIESIGGLVIFVARLAAGSTPGETLHVVAGLLLTAAYVAYQWRHWLRVRPVTPRLDYALGLLAAAFMALTLLTGLALGWEWLRDRVLAPTGAPVAYAPALSAIHNIGSMLVLTFAGAHLAAVLMRDRRPTH